MSRGTMRRLAALGAVLPELLVAGACWPGEAPHSALDPRSEAAAGIFQLWSVLLGVCLGVFVIVLGLYAWAVWHRRSGSERPGEGPGRGAGADATEGLGKLVVFGGAIVPALILLGLTAATVVTSSRLHHAAGGEGGAEPVEIHVVGHQFWWEVRYPDAGVVTANELHLPTGRPARLRLTSADVIHSFWVPQLHGKVDLTPGRETELVLHPRETGVYRGFCTEFCGAQHALMGLLVIAEPPDAFDGWLAEQAAPATPPSDPIPLLGQAAFEQQQCHFCHTVRGIPQARPPVEVGPDLTHLASRRTLAAATVPNDSANLAAWIEDPHDIKPGVRMPATAMPTEELAALVAFLQGLR